MRHEYLLLVREFHLDTFGHVNNATYLSIYEEARWELITQNGFGLEKIQESGLGPVILEVQLKFLKEIYLREIIKVTTQIQDYNGKIGHIRQQMIKPDGSIASEALFTFALFNTHERKIVMPTDEWKRAIGLLP